MHVTTSTHPQVTIQRRLCQLLLPMATLLTPCTRGQATSRARPVRAQYEQRSEETSAGHIANEKWLTARGSATLRERQRLYLQCMPPCSS